MASSNIYVTPSTSLILIKSLALSTNVLLPILNVPNFEVKIRDATGSSTIVSNPILISTTGGAKFIDNTTTYSINQPYGFVNVGLRNSTIWQILHTSGQTPANSAANVGTTNVSTTYFGLVSTAQKNVSSLFMENLNTPNSITLQGPFIVGNLSTPGFIQFESTLNVYGDATFDKSLFVSGATQFLSSVWAETLFPLSTVLRSFSSVGAGGSVSVGESVNVTSSFHTRSTLQVNTLAVLKETSEKTTEIGNLTVAGSISTVKQLAVANQTVVQQNLTINQTLSSLSGAFSTGTLVTTGDITTFGSLSTLSSASFFSSFTTLSSLFINDCFSTFSTANITNLVSTQAYITNLLSSGTSFSTAGDFTVLSTLTVNGSLSSSKILVGKFFSTNDILVQKNVLTSGSATFDSGVSVDSFANLNELNVRFDMGIGGNLDVNEVTTIDTLNIQKNLLVNNDFNTQGAILIRQNLGAASDVEVKGNLTVLGIPYVGTFNVDNYEVSTLQIITSSPSIALRVSTLNASTLQSRQAKLVFSPTSGNTSISVFSTPIRANSISAEKVYAKTTQTNLLTVNSLYTQNLLHEDSTLPIASLPKFEIYQKSSFPRGLSTQRLLASTTTADLVIASFIGDGSLLSDIQPPFSTLSANIVTASTIQVGQFSTVAADFYGGMTVSTNLLAYNTLQFGTGEFTSTGTEQMATVSFQPVNESLLGINNVLYLDASNRRVGINTSTPMYNLDIRGSLYYTGQLYYSFITASSFSTVSTNVFFSTIFYSSIFAENTLLLPSPSNLLTLRANNPTYSFNNPLFPIFDVSAQYYNLTFSLGDVEYPQNVFAFLNGKQGVFTDRFYSTTTIGQGLFVNNNTKNVGITTIQPVVGTSNYIPKSVDSSIDLSIAGSFRASELNASTVVVFDRVLVSTLEMPQLGINTAIVSTFNTMSTTFSFAGSELLNWGLTVNKFVEFIQQPFRKGSIFINRPPVPFQKDPNVPDISVYSGAFISSLFITDRCEAQSISLGAQDL